VRGVSRATIGWAAAGVAIAVAAGVTGFVITDHGHAAQATVQDASAGLTHGQGVAGMPRVLSVTPANGSRAVNGTGQVAITFVRPLPGSILLPRLSPSVAGTWYRQGSNTLVFVPQTGFSAGTRVTVWVPQGGTDGSSVTWNKAVFTTGAYSNLRLQQLLAQLGYLPMSWTADLGNTITPGDTAEEIAAAYTPPAGSFTRQGGYPSALYSFWKEGRSNLLERGAIAGFEGDHNMPANGVATPAVWAAVLKAAVNDKRNTRGYSYAVASQGSPESLTIWHDGRVVLDSVANTGMADAPTPVGTFPVYEKLPFQIMQGTNPGGSHYADPVEWVSYFSGGAAVHYYDRGSYGYPQSLGCVELPYTAAKQSYSYLPYGTLVTVTP
jgi:hypothetical protein